MTGPGSAGEGVTRRSFMAGAAASGVATVLSPPWPLAPPRGGVKEHEADVPVAYADLALRLIIDTAGYSPPVAARALGYFGVTLYEALVPGMRDYRSLVGVPAGLASLPHAGRAGDHWPMVANAALASILRELFRTAPAADLAAIDSLEQSFVAQFGRIPPGISARSQTRGEDVAQAIYQWSTGDGGHEAYLRNFPSSYIVPVGEGLWVPTPPAFQAIPLQPFWGSNRPFAISSGAACPAPPPPTYSTDPSSLFYTYGREVYDTVNNLTAEQQTIASYWADGAGTFTPPGHSISMLTQVLRYENADLERAAEAYLKVGCAVADAFIQCWHTKYVWNLLRPVTYIRANIEGAWSSLIATPPFPEYTSGHSTQSGAWGASMTALFGDAYGFTDHSHDASGFAPRSFGSFMEAAEEAMVSRLYGGIHFRFGNEAGLACGVCVGEAVAALPILD
jgi:hypothetical protein